MFRKLSLIEVVLLSMFVLFTGLLVPAQLIAQEYPSRPIQFINPWPPGGVPDTLFRILHPKVMEHLGQPIIMVNKPGAGGALATIFLAGSKPDGYTIGVGNCANLGTAKAINPKLEYDPEKDFTPICNAQTYTNTVLVRSDSPLNTLEKLIDYAKKNPGKLNYGSSGVGTTLHFMGEMLNQYAGIKMVHIPYKGSGPLVVAFLGGHIDVMMSNIGECFDHIQTGKLIPLAVAAPQRVKLLPHVPTFIEQGYPDIVIQGWQGVIGPAGLPKPIVNIVAESYKKVLALTEIQEKLLTLTWTATYLGPDDFRKLILSDLKKYQNIANKANIRVE